MKKGILMAVLLLVTTMFAQTSQSVNFKINLYSVQSLVINPTQTEVELNYQSKEDYLNGVSTIQNDHLEIYSTGGFKIQAQSTDLTNPEENIDLSSVTLVPSNGSNSIPGSTYTTSTLSNNPVTIIESNIGGVDKNFSIEYIGAGSNQYVNKYHSGEEPTTYT